MCKKLFIGYLKKYLLFMEKFNFEKYVNIFDNTEVLVRNEFYYNVRSLVIKIKI